MREHALSGKSSPAGHLAIHCDRCECAPKFEETTIVLRHNNKRSREFTEAFYISRSKKGTCVSAPSVTHYLKKIELLGQWELGVVTWV